MGIPEGIEASEPVKGLGKLNNAAPEPSCSECESNYHARQHYNSSHALSSFDQIYIFGFMFSKVLNQILVVVRYGDLYKPWKITGKMVPSMENDTNYNGCSNGLQRFIKVKHNLEG